MGTNELEDSTKKRISKLRDEDTSIRQVSKKLDVSRPTVRKYQDYEYSEADFTDDSEEREDPAETGSNPKDLIKSYKESEEVNDMAEQEEQDESNEVINHCGNCGEKFTGQPNKCPGCSAEFDWDNVIEV